MTQLEGVIDTAAPLARKGAQQPGERKDEEKRRGLVDGCERGKEPNWRQRRIDSPRDREITDEEARRDAERDPGMHRGDRKVAGELGDERR